MVPVPVSSSYWNAASYPSSVSYRLLADNIGFLGYAYSVPDSMPLLANTRAIIIDLRGMPQNWLESAMPYLEPTSQPAARFAVPDIAHHPGSFLWSANVVYGPPTANPDYYKGRLVVLVDERTQGANEYSALGFRSLPATTVIGSRTAGGPLQWPQLPGVSEIRLPGGFSTYFTGLGVFYPDGTPTIGGIVPDIEVRPTIAGIRQGRDEVMEAAIAFINSHPSPGGNRETPSSADDRRGVARVRIKR